MGIINKAIPNITRDELGRLHVNPVEEVFIDDAFDPLFNRNARAYLTDKYGNPILGTLGGYAEMFENMFTKHNDKWGKLGPAMGVLGTFGRTIDKAEDFLLGGVTEGVNVLNKINPLAGGEAPSNPISNIFVEDQDYTGQRLMAAMANSMSKLAGGATINEDDFKGAWAVPSIGIELMTDPGILGGMVAKAKAPYVRGMSSKDIIANIGKNPNGSTVGEIAQLLSNYDDLLTKGAWDMTLPGSRILLKNTLGKLHQLVGGSINHDFVNAKISPDTTGDTVRRWKLNPEDMSDLTPDSPPRDFNVFRKTKNPDVSKVEIVPNAERQALLDEMAKSVDTANIEMTRQMLDNLNAKYHLDADAELAPYYNNLRQIINDADVLTNGIGLPSIEDLQKVQDDLVAKRLLAKTAPTPELAEEISNLENLRSDMLKNYKVYNSDIFNDEIKKLDYHMNKLHKVATKEDAVTRMASYKKDINEFGKRIITDKNYNKHFNIKDVKDFVAKNNENIEDFKKQILAGEFDAESGNVGHQLTSDNIIPTNEKYLEKAIENHKEELIRSMMTAEDLQLSDTDFANKIDKGLDKVMEDYSALVKANVNPFKNNEDFVQKIIDETLTKDDHLNKIIKNEFYTYFGELPYVESPIYVSLSTKKWQKPLLKRTEALIELRFRKAILESPTLWHVDNVKDYIKELQKDPVFVAQFNKHMNDLKELEAFEIKNYGKTMPYSKNYKEGFSKTLASILSSSYVKDGSAKQIEASTWLKNADEFTSKILELENVDASPYIKPLVDAAKDVQEKYIPLVKLNIEDAVDDTLGKNPINESLNNLLRKNPTYFLDDSGKYIDYNKLKQFADSVPNIELHFNKEAFKDGTFKGLKFTTPTGITISESPKIIENLDSDITGTRIHKISTPTYINVNRYMRDLRLKTSNKLYDSLKKDMSMLVNTLEPDEFKKVVTTYTPELDYNYKLMEDSFLNEYDIPSELSREAKIKYFEEHATPKDKYFFDLVRDGMSVKRHNFEGDLATMRMKQVEDLDLRASRIKGKYDQKTIGNVLQAMDEANDDIIRGKDLLNDIATSQGFFITPTTKANKALSKVIDDNIAKTTIVLENGKVLPLFKKIDKTHKGTRFIGLMLNTDIDVMKNIKKFKLDNLDDIVFNVANPKALDRVASYNDLVSLLNDSSTVSSDLMKTFGMGENLTDNYFKHALILEDDSTVVGANTLNRARAKLLNDIYSDLPIDDLEQMSNQLIDNLKLRKTLGVVPTTRKLRGNIADWNSLGEQIFSYDPQYIIRNTFSTGAFDNMEVQSYVDLFVNDNFKLSTYKFDRKRLKDLLYKTDKNGSRANLYNMELVAPVFDETTGNLKKFKRFDKMTDKGLDAALANKDTILIPSYIMSPLDRILRKDVKMSNKFYAFMNKYFVLPFKFNTLMNPGWIVGNVNDAVFKQATSMSNKYGTSVAEEIANTVTSLKQVDEINNIFGDVFDTYLKDNAEMLEKAPFLKIPSNIPNNKFCNKQFIDWFSSAKTKAKLSKEEQEVTRLWLYINSVQETTFRPKDLDIVDEMAKKNKYNIPTSKADRILYGNPASEGIGKYGIAANNPLSDKIFDISTGWETRVRSANILNDLTHKYDRKEIQRILSNARGMGEDGVSQFTKEYKQLNVDVADAINAMNHANFDYNNMPDFMDHLSTFIPFPTFYMKNIAYWMDVAVNHPELIDSIITVQDNAWRDKKNALKTDEFAASAKGRGAIPLPNAGRLASKLPIQSKGILKPTPFNSMFSAFGSLNHPLEDLAQRSHPMFAPITHHLLDDEDVKYRPYSTNPYEKNIRKGDPNFSKLRYTFHRMNPFERTINTALRTPAKIREGNAQLSDVLPSIFQPDFSKTSKPKNKKATK